MIAPDDLVIGVGVGRDGGGGLDLEGQRCAADRLRKWPTRGPERECTGLWGARGVTARPRPRAPHGRPSCAEAGPSRPPSHGHGIPEQPLCSPLDPSGTPPPRPAGLAAFPPLGIDRLATRGRGSRACAPSPRSGYAGRGLGAAPSPLRAAAGPDSPPAWEAETHRALPIAPAPPRRGRQGDRARAQPPRPAAPGPPPHPRPSPPRRMPSRARASPSARRQAGRGARGGLGGRGGVARRRTTTSGAAGRF